MLIGSWISENWFTILQSVGIIGGLWYTGRSFRLDAEVRKVSNYFEIVAHHRRIWSQLYERSALKRVLQDDIDVEKKPVTQEEEIFVIGLLIHLSVILHATQNAKLDPLEGSEKDICQFFRKPIPRAVWEKMRELQSPNVVNFIDRILRDTKENL